MEKKIQAREDESKRATPNSQAWHAIQNAISSIQKRLLGFENDLRVMRNNIWYIYIYDLMYINNSFSFWYSSRLRTDS